MLRVYEFEVFEDGGLFLALPYDFDGGTQGGTFAEACEAAAGWLQSECEERALHGLPFPEPTFGNEPRNGGKTVIVAVSAGRDTVRKVRAAQAAEMLGVTRGRVSQMISAGRLESFRDGGTVWVTADSVEARMAEAPKAGRPRKTAMA